MEVARVTVAGWAVATLVAGAVSTGCGNGNKTSSPSSSATSSSAASSTGSGTARPSAQPNDYSALLIKASDIGGDFSAAQPPVLNPNGAAGVAQLFAIPDNSRRISDTISIAADSTAAAAGLDNTKANYGGKVSGAWLVKGTRLPVWAIMNHADEFTPDEIANEIFEGVSPDTVRRIIEFARQHEPSSA